MSLRQNSSSVRRIEQSMTNITVAVAVALLLAVSANSQSEEESIFESTFRELHRGPPLKTLYQSGNVQTFWIEQRLNHFSRNDNRTWQMRYMSNNELYRYGGPLFIFVGGEGSITPHGISSNSHFYDMAREHKGYLFFTEHRYYGQSYPTKDLTVKNLKYLNVRQALADLAHFIRTMKATIPGASNSKVILAGGSYSGTMVTWFKKLYPELATGCWASGAPLVAKADFYEFMEVAGESIKLVGGQACYDRIQRATAELEWMFANNRGAEVMRLFRLCDNFQPHNKLDVWAFFSIIATNFAGLAQGHTGGKIQGTCNWIMQGGNDLNGLVNYFAAIWRERACINVAYKDMLSFLSNTVPADNIMRQWIFQTCNEFGWFQTSTSANQPFGTKFPLAFYTQWCQDVFGSKYSKEFIEKQIDATNKFFGGLRTNVKNVYMSHGQLDPWRAMGINDTAGATIIPLASHCQDFSSISWFDSHEMRASKERVAALVRKWIAE